MGTKIEDLDSLVTRRNPPLILDTAHISPAMAKRLLAAAVDGPRKKMWANSKWK